MARSVVMRYTKVDRGAKHISEPSSNNAGSIVLVLMPHEKIVGGDNC